MENLSFFCQFFLFFLHLLSPQLLGTHFFVFLANFFIDVGLYHWIFFIKMACSMLIYAKIMENLSFLPIFSIFLTLAVSTVSWDPFFRIPHDFLHGYRSFLLNFHHENSLYQDQHEQKEVKKGHHLGWGEKNRFFSKSALKVIWFSLDIRYLR